MSYQVGDQVTLALAPVPSTGSVIYSYVWSFWDGTSTATTTPFVAKVVNIGGMPGTDQLDYTCQPVALDGQSTVISGSIFANNPPTILTGGTISNNDDYFTYLTQLSISAIDQDGDSFGFSWYTGTTYLGAGTTVAAGNASGTWTGNGTTLVADYPASRNYIDLTISSDRTVTCYVVDTRSGTASVDFALRGEDNPPPAATMTAGVSGVTVDSASPPLTRIGPGQTVNFTVYTAPLLTHNIGFSWTFSGSRGWTMPPISETGTTTVLENGGYQNSVNRDISTEVVSTGTSKGVVASVRVTATNKVSGQTSHSDLDYEVTLVKNSNPSSISIARSIDGTSVVGTGPVVTGSLIEFAATGTDPDADVLFYKWQFAQPFAPATAYYWGAKVLYDTTGYASGQTVQGLLSAYDALGGTLTVVLPLTNIL